MKTVYDEEMTNKTILRQNGFRVTKAKLQLLKLLKKAGQPLTVEQIENLWPSKSPVITTLYRSLNDLSLAKIIQKSDLNTGTAHFEYVLDRPHHHHLICNHCGSIAEIPDCSVVILEKNILATTRQFKNITGHNLEFFGNCLKCVDS